MAASVIPFARPRRQFVIANDNAAPTPPSAPALAISSVYALRNRKAIEDEIERLIALLDADDGDCDLEDGDSDLAADDVGEVEDWRPEGVLLPFPVYGADQSLGPINEAEAHRAYRHGHMRRAF